jgi:thiamine biosynthesis lipoprotein
MTLAMLNGLGSGCDRLRRRQPLEEKVMPAGADPAKRTGGAESVDPRLYEETRPFMGTLFRITLPILAEPRGVDGAGELAESRRLAIEAVRAAFREIERVERLFSPHIPGTPISRINEAAAESPPRAVKVTQEVFNLVHESLQLSERSEGAFDITFGPLGALWAPTKSGAPRELPTPAQLRDAQSKVGFKLVELSYEETSVRLGRKGMQLGLGAIAKGYAVDQVALVLRARGRHDFIVDGGGDLFVAGRHPDRPWRVGIKDPRRPETYFASFATQDRAVVTSGDYERYFLKDGKRYHHIIDPRSGRPASGLMSVTVIHPKATLADSLSTAAFVLGPRKGHDFLARQPEVEFLMVTTQGQVLTSPGLKESLTQRPVTVAP